jgi:hypothetical protein
VKQISRLKNNIEEPKVIEDQNDIVNSLPAFELDTERTERFVQKSEAIQISFWKILQEIIQKLFFYKSRSRN